MQFTPIKNNPNMEQYLNNHYKIEIKPLIIIAYKSFPQLTTQLGINSFHILSHDNFWLVKTKE
jgi:hypothetical protein